MVENLMGCTNNIIHMSAANYYRLPKLVPNKSVVTVLKHDILIYKSN